MQSLDRQSDLPVRFGARSNTRMDGWWTPNHNEESVSIHSYDHALESEVWERVHSNMAIAGSTLSQSNTPRFMHYDREEIICSLAIHDLQPQSAMQD